MNFRGLPLITKGFNPILITTYAKLSNPMSIPII